jgi:hypothetical protein
MSDQDPPSPDVEDDEVAPVIAETLTGQPAPPLPKSDAAAGAPAKSDSSDVGPAKSERPRLELARDPLYREARGYRMRLEPADLARLRELPGSKGKSDEELGEAFFDGQSDRFTTALAEDVPAPAEIRVVVDPYSRQAFLALENKIRAILSF